MNVATPTAPSLATALCTDTDRDWREDLSGENGSYGHTCIACGKRFVGHKRRITCKVCAQKDVEEAKRRAEWLAEHRAPVEWVITTVEEVQAIRREYMDLHMKFDAERRVRRELAAAAAACKGNHGGWYFQLRDALRASEKLDAQIAKDAERAKTL